MGVWVFGLRSWVLFFVLSASCFVLCSPSNRLSYKEPVCKATKYKAPSTKLYFFFATIARAFCRSAVR